MSELLWSADGLWALDLVGLWQHGVFCLCIAYCRTLKESEVIVRVLNRVDFRRRESELC